ncbi:hypothetical protein BT96DRAFT_918210 [Gymnopus androsaceus JB14]|uniref:TPR-like protein n=1 Tax=Gymnopus androsaceus JB14 TaxID=1447944 RepID=A0A6A4HZK2_9AGAR|nr:hypothetical protein BT96DRAFT_918210 [Gymnopus androsaceus JB14]
MANKKIGNAEELVDALFEDKQFTDLLSNAFWTGTLEDQRRCVGQQDGLQALREFSKAKGDALFREGKYTEALEQYSDALKPVEKAVTPDDAILYSNRSACRLKLKQQAIELDPSFSKAYARLATAQQELQEYHLSRLSWEMALQKLPKTNLTQPVLDRISEYTTGRDKAHDASIKHDYEVQTRILNTWKQTGSVDTDLPWIASAKEMKPRLVKDSKEGASTRRTCVEYLLRAHDDLAGAARALKDQDYMTALTLMSNAVLTDYRVVQLKDLYNMQDVGGKSGSLCNTWPADSTLDFIKDVALKRLETDGEGAWDTLRPALDVTVRAWICDAIFRDRYHENRIGSAELLTWALEMVQWGCEQWKDVREEVRGKIFETTFVRCVQKLYIESLSWELFASKPPRQKEIFEITTRLLSEFEAQPAPPGTDPVLLEVAYNQSKSQALRIQAYYYSSLGETTGEDYGTLQRLWFSGFPSQEHKNFALAAECYVKVAEGFPEDDENYAVFLGHAVRLTCGAMQSVARTTLQLSLLERVRLAIPKMEKIWTRSYMVTKYRDNHLNRVLEFEQDLVSQRI